MQSRHHEYPLYRAPTQEIQAPAAGNHGTAAARAARQLPKSAYDGTPLKRAGRSFSLDGSELLGFCDLEPLGAQRRHALGTGAARLRGLLRLSLMDDNDLQLAQRALREAAAFFEALRAAAAHAGRTPHALWASLQQPGNARG